MASQIIINIDGGRHQSNPGPFGSGICILGFLPTATNLSTYPLGWGTNNLSELATMYIEHRPGLSYGTIVS